MEIQIKNKEREIRRAVFLDRDGVLNRTLVRDGKPYPPISIDEFEILPGIADACEKLKRSGYKTVVATNQPNVGRGTLSQSIVEEMHSFLLKKVPIDRIEVCYHPGREESNCECRKPLPGMLLRAAHDLGLDLSESWMVGDRYGDVVCGQAAGCRTILIGDGYNEESGATPDFRANDLPEATKIILSHSTPN